MLNKDIVTMYRGLTSLASDLETKLPAKVSFAIVRNIKLLTPIVEDIDFTRQSVAATYGVEVDGGYSIPEQQIDTVNQELTAIAETEVDVPIVKVKMSDIENLNISVGIAEALEFMIEEEI